jgi:hypothetical protein
MQRDQVIHIFSHAVEHVADNIMGLIEDVMQQVLFCCAIS